MWQNIPVTPAVIITPSEDINIEGIATGLAIFQFVPNPPKNIINISPIEHNCFVSS